MDDKRADLLGNLAQRELRVSVEPIRTQALWRIKEADGPIGPRAFCQTQHTVALECDDLLLGAYRRTGPVGTSRPCLHYFGQRRSITWILAMWLRELTLRERLAVAVMVITGRPMGSIMEVDGDGR